MPAKKDPAPIPALEKGYYRLTADVTNPRPDGRRTRHRDSQAVWPKGLLVKVKPPVEGYRVGTVEFADGGYVFYGGGGGKSNAEQRAGDDIVRNLEPAPDTLGIVIRESVGDAGGLLAHLIESGKITLADVKAASAAVEAMPDGSAGADRDEYGAMRKRHGLAYFGE